MFGPYRGPVPHLWNIIVKVKHQYCFGLGDLVLAWLIVLRCIFLLERVDDRVLAQKRKGVKFELLVDVTNRYSDYRQSPPNVSCSPIWYQSTPQFYFCPSDLLDVHYPVWWHIHTSPPCWIKSRLVVNRICVYRRWSWHSLTRLQRHLIYLPFLS